MDLPPNQPPAWTAFDEAIAGDASNDRFNPTQIELFGGDNIVRGSFGISAVPDVHDIDYLSFTVGEGFELTSLRVRDASVGGAFAFVAMQAGPTITIPADWTSIETPLLGWAHFGSASVGSDLLAEMSVSPGSVGFSGPLPAGTYTLWIMELNSSEQYFYDFAVGIAAVPAPCPLLALLAATSGSRTRSRSRRS